MKEEGSKQKLNSVLIGFLIILLVGMMILIYSVAYNNHKKATYEKAMTEYYNSKIQDYLASDK